LPRFRFPDVPRAEVRFDFADFGFALEWLAVDGVFVLLEGAVVEAETWSVAKAHTPTTALAAARVRVRIGLKNMEKRSSLALREWMRAMHQVLSRNRPGVTGTESSLESRRQCQ
jgi:hypothetical protein